jgi:hypothetical protein
MKNILSYITPISGKDNAFYSEGHNLIIDF